MPRQGALYAVLVVAIVVAGVVGYFLGTARVPQATTVTTESLAL